MDDYRKKGGGSYGQREVEGEIEEDEKGEGEGCKF
jgi:hypothetical protein